MLYDYAFEIDAEGTLLKIIGTSILCFATILVCGSSSAHAAIAQLTCSSTNGSSLSTNVSYYNLGVANSTSIAGQVPGLVRWSSTHWWFIYPWPTFKNCFRQL